MYAASRSPDVSGSSATGRARLRSAAAVKLLGVFEPAARRAAWVVVTMMLASALLEAVGIGLVAPFVGLLARPEILHESAWLSRAYAATGATTPREFVLLLSVVLMLVFLVKNTIVGFGAYLQARFTFGQQASLSRRLYSCYLSAPYAFHLERHSTESLKNFATEIGQLFSGVVMPLFLLLSEFFVVALLAALLVAIAPVVTAATLAFAIAALLTFYALFRGSIRHASERRAREVGRRLKLVSHGLHGLKEIKVLGREVFFTEAFDRSNSDFARASGAFAVLNQMPRLFVEFAAVVVIVGVVVVFTLANPAFHAAVEVLALFAVAAVRLVPSVTRILGAISSIRFYLPALEAVHRDLALLEDAPASPPRVGPPGGTTSFHGRIELAGVTYLHPGSNGQGVTDVTLAIPHGLDFAIVGPSGAGKTTLVDLLLGLIEPQSGRITVDGTNVHNDIVAWRVKLGYVSQVPYLLDDSVRGNVAFGLRADEIDDARVWTALERAQLASRIRSVPAGLDARVGERGALLSGGEQQRLALARALYHDPEVLILDEPTSALDAQTEQEIVATLRALKGTKTLVIVTHRASTIRDCRGIAYLEGGRLAGQGTFEELIRTTPGFCKVMGEDQASAAAPQVAP